MGHKVRLMLESLEDRTLPSTYNVIGTSDDIAARVATADPNIFDVNGLRSAINFVNADKGKQGPSIITFTIPNNLAFTFTPLIPLPTIVFPVTIDGTSQPNYANDTPIITIDGSNCKAGNGFTLEAKTANGSTIQGLIIDKFTGNGIEIDSDTSNVYNCIIGTNASNSKVVGNTQDGVLVTGKNDTVGGGVSAQRNVISGNGENGVHIVFSVDPNYGSDNTIYRNENGEIDPNGKNNKFGQLATIQNNFIGIDISGLKAIPNANDGILIEGGVADSVVLNKVSANTKAGVEFTTNPTTGADADANKLTSNFIGVAADGTSGLGNAIGVLASGVGGLKSAPNIIGSSTGDGNIISANGTGISLTNSSSQFIVAGNIIGMDKTGDTALGNKVGVSITDSSFNTIGGTGTDATNVISGNENGITINNTSTGNYVNYNNIGLSQSGNGVFTTDAKTNIKTNSQQVGINLGIDSNLTFVLNNVISGNSDSGVKIFANANVLNGNFIGTTLDGKSSIDGQSNGVIIFGNATGNFIGQDMRNNPIGKGVSATPAYSNVISDRVDVNGPSNSVISNFMGVDVTGKNQVSSAAGASLSVSGGATNTTISANVVMSILVSGPTAQANISQNTIGMNFAKTQSLGYLGIGIHVINKAQNSEIYSNTIAGIAGILGDGIVVEGNLNNIHDNTIGLVVNGKAIGNAGTGVTLAGDGNTVKFNTIIGNTGNGVLVKSGTGNILESNFIGQTAAGDVFPNGGANKIQIEVSPASTKTVIKWNTISNGMEGIKDKGEGTRIIANTLTGGSQDAIVLSGSIGAVVEDNIIGIANDGSADGASGNGITVASGTTRALISNNTVANNGGFGVSIEDSSSNQMSNNSIFGNGLSAIRALNGQGNLITQNTISQNGDIAGPNGIVSQGSTGLMISGNEMTGGSGDEIVLSGDVSDIVQENFIGVHADGTPGGGQGNGITLSNGTTGAMISANTISNNGGQGVAIQASSNNQIFQNSILLNSLSAVLVSGGNQNLISINSIAQNGSTGIILNGGNNSQPSPSLSYVYSATAGIQISGSLSAAPSTSYQIEFFESPQGSPVEGASFIGSMTVDTDAAGFMSFNVPFAPSAGTFLTATATDPNNNTSEFSNPLPPSAGMVTFTGNVWLGDEPGGEDAYGGVLPGVKVTLRDGSGNTVASTWTDSAGDYWLAGPAGASSYTVVVSPVTGLQFLTSSSQVTGVTTLGQNVSFNVGMFRPDADFSSSAPYVVNASLNNVSDTSPIAFEAEFDEDGGGILLPPNAPSLPAGAELLGVGDDGEFSWVPTAAGQVTFDIGAVSYDFNSGQYTYLYQPITINVRGFANPLPNGTTVTAGTAATFQAAATDPSGSAYQFGLSGSVPAGAEIDATTGAFSWTPTPSQAGVATFNVVVLWADGTADIQPITIDVRAFPNPLLHDTLTSNAGAVITLPLQAVDPSGGAIVYSLGAGAAATASIDAGNNFIWTPTQAGSTTFSIIATWSDNTTTAQTVTINVRDFPNPLPNGPLTVNANSTIVLPFAAVDPSGGVITYQLGNNAPFDAWIDANNNLNWGPSQAGATTFDIIANWSDGTTTTQTITINVRDFPNPLPNGPLTTDANTAIAFPLAAVDPTGGTITYSLSGTVPTGATVNNTTHTFSWTPTDSQEGVNTFNIVATWSNGTPSVQPVTINVRSFPNPVASGATVSFGVPVVFQAQALDPTSNGTVYTLDNPPDGAFIDPVSGIFLWVPTAAQAGSNVFTVRANWSDGTSDAQTVTINVLSTPAVTGVAINAGTAPIIGASESGSTVTITTDGAHGFAAGDPVVIAGVGSGYDGAYQIATVAANSFTIDFGTTTGLSSVSNSGTATDTALAGGLLVNGSSSATSQRSMVDSITYTFNEAVNLAANAFTITATGQGGQAPSVSYASPDGGRTWVVTFSGTGVSGNSIANGEYQIVLNASAVSAVADTSAPAGNDTETFYRLFGDSMGNGHYRVNGADNNAFLGAFGSRSTGANFLAYVDVDANGRINGADNNAFLGDFGTHYAGFTATI